MVNLANLSKHKSYDTSNKAVDVYDMDNMDDGITKVAMTTVERNKLSGLDTGDKLTVTAVEKADIATISSKVNLEEAQDGVGLILTDTNTVDLTYDDGTPEITADIKYQNTITTNISDDASGLKVDVVENSSKQKLDISKAGVVTGTRKEINLIEGTNVTLTLTDDVVNDRVDVTINSTAVAGSIDVQKDDLDIVTSMTTLNFEGNVTVTDEGSNKATVNIGGSGTDETVKISSVDTTTGYLEDKLIGTTDKITITKNNTGANENLQIGLGADVFDTSSDTMDDITDGATYVKTENNYTDAEKTKLGNITEVSTDTFGIETKVIDTFLHASHKGAKYDYHMNNGTLFRTGTLLVVTDGTTPNSNINDVSVDIGDSTGVSFNVAINGTDLELSVTSGSVGWTINFKKQLL